jgi:hypothetical protein
MLQFLILTARHFVRHNPTGPLSANGAMILLQVRRDFAGMQGKRQTNHTHMPK